MNLKAIKFPIVCFELGIADSYFKLIQMLTLIFINTFQVLRDDMAASAVRIRGQGGAGAPSAVP